MGALKEHVYSNNPRTLLHLQENIRLEIESIGAEILVKVFRNLEQRDAETGLMY